MEKPIQVLLCEDQEIISDGLRNSLSKEKDIKVGAVLSDADLILDELHKGGYTMLITDIITENKHNVLDVLPLIRKEFPQLKIIVITGYPDVAFMEKARKSGANSFIYKNAPFQDLLSLIRNTKQGYSIYPSSEKTHAEILASLTPMEMKVLRLFCNGNDRGEIAEILCISISSVKKHISSILSKTGFPSFVKLGMYVVKEGLILPE